MRHFPETLRQARRQRGWTQRELAGRLGVTTSTVCRWERGHTRPNASRRQALECLLGLPATAFLSPALGAVKRSTGRDLTPIAARIAATLAQLVSETR